MPISPVNSASVAFSGKKAKKKVKTKAALKAAGAVAIIGAGALYATQKGKGGLIDAIIAELQPLKKSVVKFASDKFNKIFG